MDRYIFLSSFCRLGSWSTEKINNVPTNLQLVSENLKCYPRLNPLIVLGESPHVPISLNSKKKKKKMMWCKSVKINILNTMQFSKKNCTMQSSRTTTTTTTHIHTYTCRASFMGEQTVSAHRVLPGRTPHLVLCSTAAILIYLMIFKQGILHFHFAIDSENYVASSTHMHTLIQTHSQYVYVLGLGGVPTVFIT